jgi:hypothetical protein
MNSRYYRVFLLTGFFLGSLMLISGLRPTTAHEPITTKIMFNKEVVRILQKNCLECHKPGGIAPWSLVTYEEARPWAKAIKEELLTKRMPPWPAVRGFGDFQNAPALTQREIDLIVNWVEGGAPPGKPEDLPREPLINSEWPLGDPHQVLKLEQEQRVAADADERRIFSFPLKLKEDRWINAIDLKPGDGSVVHCAEFYAATGESKPKLLATWTPGHGPIQLPAGAGFRLGRDASISVRIHYRGVGEDVKDKSAIGLYFTKNAPQNEVAQLILEDGDFVIPNGSDRHQVKATLTLDRDRSGFAIIPAMSPLLASLEVTAYRPDATVEVLVWVRGQRFDWRPTYVYKRPVPLPAGTRLELTAYFDNSDNNRNNPNSPPKQLRWSEVTTNPLCILLASGDAGRLPEHTGLNSK